MAAVLLEQFFVEVSVLQQLLAMSLASLVVSLLFVHQEQTIHQEFLLLSQLQSCRFFYQICRFLFRLQPVFQCLFRLNFMADLFAPSPPSTCTAVFASKVVTVQTPKRTCPFSSVPRPHLVFPLPANSMGQIPLFPSLFGLRDIWHLPVYRSDFGTIFTLLKCVKAWVAALWKKRTINTNFLFLNNCLNIL